ncbi:hypothetical protein [Caballeronia grimmiae]|uniref:hypothetical protein n=1 Tax=Caballeronia grimmiae TaxID=1071679 RepID=UPI0038B95372
MSRVVILSLASLSDDDKEDVALPAEVKSEQGSAVERVIISTRHATTVELPDDAGMTRRQAESVGRSGHSGLSAVVVKVATMNGPNITRRIPFIGRFAQHTIDLVPDDVPDWLTWAAAHVDLAEASRFTFSRTRAYQVWGRLWTQRFGAWRPVELEITEHRSNDYAKQFELITGEPSLLQIGGPELPACFVSLPTGHVKVLLTPGLNAQADDYPLNIVVSRVSEGPRNALLSLLAMDEMVQAPRLAEELTNGFDWNSVRDDPLIGCALAHAAIRLRARDRFTLADAVGLFQSARGSADAAILLANRELADSPSDLSRVLRLLDVGIGRALPVLAQSLTVASSALDVLRRHESEIDQRMLVALTEKSRMYLRARANAGPFLSFFGPTPVTARERSETAPASSSVQVPVAARTVGAALAAIATGFKPVAATSLIDTAKTAS